MEQLRTATSRQLKHLKSKLENSDLAQTYIQSTKVFYDNVSTKAKVAVLSAGDELAVWRGPRRPQRAGLVLAGAAVGATLHKLFGQGRLKEIDSTLRELKDQVRSVERHLTTASPPNPANCNTNQMQPQSLQEGRILSPPFSYISDDFAYPVNTSYTRHSAPPRPHGEGEGSPGPPAVTK